MHIIISPKNKLSLWTCLFLLLPAWAAAVQGTADKFKNRGNLYFNHGQMEKAVSEYSKAISLEPTFSEAYFNRGLANFKLGLYYKAIVNFDKVIALSPNAGDACYSRGLAYEKTGHMTLAIADFKKAAQLGDRYAKTYLNQKHIRKTIEKNTRKKKAIDALAKEKEPYGRKVVTLPNKNKYDGKTVSTTHYKGAPLFDGNEGIFLKTKFYDGNDTLRREEIYHTASFNTSNGRNRTIIWYDKSLNMEKKELYYTGKMLDTIGSHHYDKSGRLTKKILRDKHGRAIKKN